MADRGSETKFVRGAAPDLWRHTLSQIPTLFGRLVYLSSLRDQNSGKYEHHGLAQIFGHKDAEQTLRLSHAQLFAEWLAFSLEQQKRDLEEYLWGLDTDIRTTLETWVRLTPYRNFIPAAEPEPERRLYLSDLESILQLLKHEYAVASPDPDS